MCPMLSFSRDRGTRRTALFLALLTPCIGAAFAAQGADYKISAGDVLTVTVYGDNNLTGVFPVSPDGTIGYPILGNVSVLNESVAEIGNRLAGGLASHVADAAVTVAVKEYAPIFVIGDIQKPGKYEFRPGMIALELFAIGGGAREPTARTDMSGVQMISAQQEYEDMSLQLLSQDVKRVRLQAELNNVSFAYPDNELGMTRDPSVLGKFVEAERGLFNFRLSVMKAEETNLGSQRQNYIGEIETLEKSGALRNEQFKLLSLDVDASQELVTRGAASQSVLRERKRDLLAMNQQLLEFGSFLSRAQQNKNEVERRILELQSKRRSDAATELREIELDTLRLKSRMAFSLQTMAEIGASARRVTADAQLVKTQFAIMRRDGDNYLETIVTEDTGLKAGDVLRVTVVPVALSASTQAAIGSN